MNRDTISCYVICPACAHEESVETSLWDEPRCPRCGTLDSFYQDNTPDPIAGAVMGILETKKLVADMQKFSEDFKRVVAKGQALKPQIARARALLETLKQAV